MENRGIEGLNRDECPSGTSQESKPFTAPNEFPDELIRQILLRLPVKSLLKFRCVSKSWLSLISSSQFAKAHVKISTHNKSYNHHRVVTTTVYIPLFCEVVDFSLQSLLNELTIYPVNLGNPVIGISNTLGCFAATCDGLICIKIDNNLILWNPSIRKTKKLPSLGLIQNCLPVNCGISYDYSSDDYKVVVTIKKVNFHYGYSGCGYEVKVYSLKNESWRKIGGFHGVNPIGDQVNVSGKLHWVESGDASLSCNIVSIDLATEMFGVLEPPHSEVGKLWKLLVFSGQFLCAYYASASSGHLWVMKEYGVKESWTELVTISFDTIGSFYTIFTPVYVFGNGEVVLYGELQSQFLAVYNSKNKTFRFPRIDYSLPSTTVIIYVESLVSPV